MVQEHAMGLTFVDGKVIGPDGDEREVRFLVDSGASYTLLPQEVWQQLQLKPKRTVSFVLADGTTIERDVSECQIEFAGQQAHTPVILGENGDEALLGIITLEILGFVLDPFKRTLQAMKMRLS
jgi:clan AA aspartic protease